MNIKGKDEDSEAQISQLIKRIHRLEKEPKDDFILEEIQDLRKELLKKRSKSLKKLS